MRRRKRGAREQLIAIDQIEERHRLLAQRMEDVMIVVDDVAVLTTGLWRTTRKQLPDRRTTDYEEARVQVSRATASSCGGSSTVCRRV